LSRDVYARSCIIPTGSVSTIKQSTTEQTSPRAPGAATWRIFIARPQNHCTSLWKLRYDKSLLLTSHVTNKLTNIDNQNNTAPRGEVGVTLSATRRNDKFTLRINMKVARNYSEANEKCWTRTLAACHTCSQCTMEYRPIGRLWLIVCAAMGAGLLCSRPTTEPLVSMTNFRSLAVNALTAGHIKTAEQRTTIQKYADWYTGRWWLGCYFWYSEEGPGRAAVPPSPILAVPNVTPSKTSVPTSCGTM